MIPGITVTTATRIIMVKGVERKEGYFRETENGAVMEKVDREGNTIGFSILNVSALKKNNFSNPKGHVVS